ncbi:uncharacterized protein [Apostichopus japonicus]|uniref:uncharacterized protein isoform X1 n=1 Tax=Stichopus japonicus TaxID=307972 RepID=UPI003AB77BFE
MGHMFQAIFLLLHVCASIADSENGDLCLSPQYMPLGQNGSINCDFGDQFYGVYWYNSSDYENTEPILYFTNRQKSGLGYDTEEFNIFQNGSLIINNVSLQHEGDFTVIMFREESGVTIPNFVKVIVTVEPRQEHPIIDACNGERVCVQPTNQLNKLTCYVESYRPPNNLSFSIITTNESLPLSISLSHSRNGDLYTTTANLELPIDNANIINVVSCARSSPPYLLNNDNSVIILQSSKLDLYETKPTKMYVEQGKTAILQCSHQPSIYYVWMYLKASGVLNSVSETIEHPINYEHVVNSKYLLRTGTKDLQVQDSVVDDEGIYICVFGDGIIEYVTTFELNVYKFPEPPGLLVDGCSLGQYCEIQSAGYGLLICRVRGIHPLLNITWSVVEGVPKSVVFRNEKLYANKIGDTYDVTINTEFEIKNKAADNIPVECTVDLASNHPLPFHWSRKVYIVPETAEEKTTVIPNESYIRQSPMKIILPIAAALAIIIIITAVLCSKVNSTNIRKPKRSKRNRTNVEEGIPMMTQTSQTTSEKTLISLSNNSSANTKNTAKL